MTKTVAARYEVGIPGDVLDFYRTFREAEKHVVEGGYIFDRMARAGRAELWECENGDLRVKRTKQDDKGGDKMRTPDEIKKHAQRLVESLETDELVALFDRTTAAHIKALGNAKKYAEITIVREWITDELERRDPQACAEWLESNDESPAQYYK